MKKILLLLVVSVLISYTSNAQYARCETDEYNAELMRQYPQMVKEREELEKFTAEYVREQQSKGLMKGTDSVPYIIPVVYHVLHDYGPENLSDDILINAIKLLNIDFRKMNADTASINPAFTSIAADCQIEFRLANIDPWGNCTNGIEHIYSQKTYSASTSAKIHAWPNNKYLNIWVAYNLLSQTAAASTQFPGGPGATDGMLFWYTYASNTLNTLTHEAGHYLNLYHVWGMGNVSELNCGNDSVNDTPTSKGHSPGNCSYVAGRCNDTIIENLENYMDYSYCTHMFTEGQKLRMHALLNSTINGRNNLWTDSNLVATGTAGLPVTCTPIPDFINRIKFACAGDSVQFFDQSWNSPVTTYEWSFPGGSPATSNLQNPKVAFTTSGYKNVSLKAINAAGADSITKNAVVYITSNPMNDLPFVESFEDSVSFPGNDGFIINPDGKYPWTRVTNTGGSTGTSAIMVNNFASTSGSVDDWITPSMNFSDISTPVTMTFKVANAQRSSTSYDELALFYSLDCGQNWIQTSYYKAGTSLSTVGVFAANFRPTIASQWREETVNLDALAHKPNVRFKFKNTSNHGNNTYIDDINITGNGVGISVPNDLQNEFSVYPNPTTDASTVIFSLNKSNVVELEIKDITDRIISKVFEEELAAGIHELKLPALSSGIYLIDLQIKGRHHVRKLIVN